MCIPKLINAWLVRIFDDNNICKLTFTSLLNSYCFKNNLPRPNTLSYVVRLSSDKIMFKIMYTKKLQSTLYT